MKIYISGQITGLKMEEYLPVFQEAENELINVGINPNKIVNPTKLGIPPDEMWNIAMEKCMEALEPCDAIYMTSGWIKSFGSKHELTRACEKRMKIWFQKTEDLEKIRRHVELIRVSA